MARKSLLGISLCIGVIASSGQVLRAQAKPVVGSPNVAIADPPVPRPGTKPCTVQLFPKESFGAAGENTRMDAVPHEFSYSPPAGCKAPWAKVVLEADFSVDPGHQYDRTASIWLNGVNLYFGTTEEPSPDFGPSWQVQRDLTGYTRLFRSPGKGVAWINNWVDAKRASIIHASAKLLFYPADANFPAPRTPDDIYALNGSHNAPANLESGSDQLLLRRAFPQNTTRVYLDLFTQSQFHDEFWYTCLPDRYIQQTTAFAMKRGYKGAPVHPRACSGGSYREAEVSVDGQPAGLAPIYPWVYTGGIDPFLWRPTPGIQTLDFIPYRLDLTPFAGLLSDGAQHSVSVRVLGANHYFSVAAALLVYRDSKAKRTGGAVTRNTLRGASLEPTITSTIGKGEPHVDGEVKTRAKQSYVIEGYVNTSAGRVRTRVEQSLSFANTQRFSTAALQSNRHLTEQEAHAESTVSSDGGSSKGRALTRSLDYSLKVDVLRSNHGGSRGRDVHLQQNFAKHIEQREHGRSPYQASIQNARTTSDQLTYSGEHAHAREFHNTGQNSTQTYAFTDSLGNCYRAEVKALGGKVSSFTEGQGCGAKPTQWFVHPNGWPESFGWRENESR
ncbi:MAG TPA: peptide-N4-asparagine amidase [Terriglobia bacterium]|nr:peptide-N4-asparagine amidase [Terriglobia bacterium]